MVLGCRPWRRAIKQPCARRALAKQGDEGLLVVLLELGGGKHAARLQLLDWLQEPEAVEIRRVPLKEFMGNHLLLLQATSVWPLQILHRE